MAIKAKGFFGSMKGGFKLGRKKPKVQARFLRSKASKNKNVKFMKKFLNKSNKEKRTWIKRKSAILRRKAAEKALEGGQAAKARIKKSLTSKGFNPIKFVLTIFAGWLINQLPKIIAAVKKFIDKVKPVFETLGNWIKGVVDFFKWIGGGIKNLWNTITGNTDTVDAEKKKVEDANNRLKGTFDKQKKGFDDLTKKAKKEEGSLKKDMDDLDKEVKAEESGKGVGETTTTSTSSDGKTVASTTASGDGKTSPTTTKSTPKTKFVMERVPIKKRISGRGSRYKVIGYKDVQVTIDISTGKELSRKIIKSNPNTNISTLKKETSGPKVVTVDIPIPSNGSSTSTTVINTNKAVDPDSVNSKTLALTAIDR